MKIFAFDLDGTLADSKSPIRTEIIEMFHYLVNVHHMKIAIISGCKIDQMMEQVIKPCLRNHFPVEHIHLFPTSGNAWYRHMGYNESDMLERPIALYENIIPEEERKEIIANIEKAVEISGYKASATFGPTIEDRLTQITYSALGQQAPLELKKTWDPTAEKRKAIKRILEQFVTKYDINYGGTTSLDVTFKGIDKAYAINKLISHGWCTVQEIVFFGDALQPGGNDYPAIKTGIKCIEVFGPTDTIKKSVQEAILQSRQTLSVD